MKIMDTMSAMGILAGACGLVLLIVLLKQKAQFFIQFLLRMGLGMVEILVMNDLLAKQGIGISVGVNPVSLLTSGSLGISGVALLYAIVFTQFL